MSLLGNFVAQDFLKLDFIRKAQLLNVLRCYQRLFLFCLTDDLAGIVDFDHIEVIFGVLLKAKIVLHITENIIVKIHCSYAAQQHQKRKKQARNRKAFLLIPDKKRNYGYDQADSCQRRTEDHRNRNQIQMCTGHSFSSVSEEGNRRNQN